jgi:hypothetical protein
LVGTGLAAFVWDTGECFVKPGHGIGKRRVWWEEPGQGGRRGQSSVISNRLSVIGGLDIWKFRAVAESWRRVESWRRS